MAHHRGSSTCWSTGLRSLFFQRSLALLQPLKQGRLNRTTRVVEVPVWDGKHQLDSFQLSNPDTLSAAVKPVFRHLSRTSVVEFFGIDLSCRRSTLLVVDWSWRGAFRRDLSC